MTILGILDLLGIILMISGLISLVITGIDTENEWFWLTVLIFGMFLWAFMAISPTNGKIKISLPVKYDGFKTVPRESYATSVIIWSIITIGVVLSIGSELNMEINYISMLIMASTLVVTFRVLHLVGRGFGVISDYIIHRK